MGKPYQLELQALSKTYEWALACPLDKRAAAWRRFAESYLVAVGSGGSYSAAVLATYLHERLARLPAKAVTPLEAILSTASMRNAATIILSAGGGNPDVLKAFQHLVTQEPRRLGTICARTGSRLQKLAEEFGFSESFDFDLPSGKDGFLATNSLLATAVLLVRLYAGAMGLEHDLPKKFDELLELGSHDETRANGTVADRLKGREFLIVLYGPTTKAAALDVESKCSESAIASVQAVDYRNFAHGRHHWLARRGSSTSVIAFVSDEVREVAIKTLKLFPASVTTLRIDVGGDTPRSAIGALVLAMRLVGELGESAGIDPGRPHVPTFGRKIYHLRAFGKNGFDEPSREETAIVRKSGQSLQALEASGQLSFWRAGYRSYLSQLRRAKIGGIVLDYDGTLCGESDRYDGLSGEVRKELVRLVRAGVMLGVATGRGKSTRDALRTAIPKSLWKKVVVGYYNGGDVGALADDTRPDGRDEVGEPLRLLAAALKNDEYLRQAAKIAYRLPQVSIEPTGQAGAELVWDYLQHLLARLNLPGILMLRSSHSVDIIAPLVSKNAVVEQVRMEVGEAMAILCVGDRGRYPGNDFALLGNRFSLSVDEVSPDPGQCWNLASAGHRGVPATLEYFGWLRAAAGTARFQFPGAKRVAE